jgi:hypothetical protein
VLAARGDREAPVAEIGRGRGEIVDEEDGVVEPERGGLAQRGYLSARSITGRAK